MNDSFASSVGPAPAPIPSPDDRRVLPRTTAPHSFAAALGHFLLFGLVGQVVFTAIQFLIVGDTHGQSDASASISKQLLLLGLPLLCAIWGAFDGRANPSSKVGHPLSILLLFLAVGVLGVFNLLLMALTGMAGYC